MSDQAIEVFRCPVHGIIQSPRYFGIYGPGEARWICPINLSSDERGITDDLCDAECLGPFYALLPAPIS